MPRDRFATRAAILESAATLLASNGVTGLGVNALADAAGCDKVLIYRYFGGLDGVLAALASERMLWPRVSLPSDDAHGNASLADALQALVLEEWAALSSNTLMLQSAISELTPSPNSLGPATSSQREAIHSQLIASLREEHRIPPYVDLPALLELLSAALTLLALRAAHTPPAGRASANAHAFDPASPAGWRRIEKAVGAIARALLDSELQ